MRILRVDSVGGASGDMLLGLLIDLGIDAVGLGNVLQRVTGGRVTLDTAPVAENGLHGTRATVRTHEESAHHRHLGDIARMIQDAGLSPSVTADAVGVFERLAAAEGKVHGIAPDEVHFHEVGALDAVADIVGNCWALEALGVERVHVAPLPVGQGTVRCAHGMYPLPVPAVVELLAGFPVVQTGEPHELVTPTGAALLMHWRARGEPPAGPAAVRTAGYGWGRRKLDARPNILRGTLLETGVADIDGETAWVLETNLDDCSPQVLGDVLPRAIQAGALDAYCTPVTMKKNRPGVLLTLLCAPEQRLALTEFLFRHTPTFGVRAYRVERACLARRWEECATLYGPVRIKLGLSRDRVITASPEYEDCVRAADLHGVAVRAVHEAALAAFRSGASPDGPDGGCVERTPA